MPPHRGDCACGSVIPTRAGRIEGRTLARGADGTYYGWIEPPPAGRWRVALETDAWRLPTVEIAGRPQLVRLGALRETH